MTDTNRFAKTASVEATDADRRVALAAALVPDRVDLQGDFFRQSTIESIADEYMGRLNSESTQGVMHAVFPDDRISLVESRVLDRRETVGSKPLPKGSWVVGMKVHDDELWGLVEDGIIAGVSIGGRFTDWEPLAPDEVPPDVDLPAHFPDDEPVTRIDGARVDEISYVDVPAVPDAEIATVKAAADADGDGEPLTAKSILDRAEDREQFLALMEQRGHEESEALRVWDYLQRLMAAGAPTSPAAAADGDDAAAAAAASEDAAQTTAKQSWSVHEPEYASTSEGNGNWAKPALEDFGDVEDAASAFIYSSTGFPPEAYGDLKFPVVAPDGTLRLDALDSAWRMVGQASVSAEAGRRIRAMVRRLVDRAFPESDLADRIDDWYDSQSMTVTDETASEQAAADGDHAGGTADADADETDVEAAAPDATAAADAASDETAAGAAADGGEAAADADTADDAAAADAELDDVDDATLGKRLKRLLLGRSSDGDGDAASAAGGDADADSAATTADDGETPEDAVKAVENADLALALDAAKAGRTLNSENRRRLMAAHDAIESALAADLDFRTNRFTDSPEFDADFSFDGKAAGTEQAADAAADGGAAEPEDDATDADDGAAASKADWESWDALTPEPAADTDAADAAE